MRGKGHKEPVPGNQRGHFSAQMFEDTAQQRHQGRSNLGILGIHILAPLGRWSASRKLQSERLKVEKRAVQGAARLLTVTVNGLRMLAGWVVLVGRLQSCLCY